MRRRHNLMITAISVTVGMALMTGCSNTNQVSTSKQEISSSIGMTTSLETMAVNYDEDDYYSDWKNGTYTSIELTGTSATIQGTGANINGSTLTITKGGTYVISGELTDGQIEVNSNDTNNVRVILNGVTIHSSTTAPFNVVEANKVIVSLEEGTDNVFTDGTSYVYPDATTDEPDAAFFSKADLIINGAGTLSIEGNYEDGLTSKDDLKIMEGNIEVKATNTGIKGKDLLAVKEGTIAINAGGDGMKATNDTDGTKGFVHIEGGKFNIIAGNDGIQAETNLQIVDGTFDIVSNEGSDNGETHQTNGFHGMGGQRPNGEGMMPPSFEGMAPPEGEEMTVPRGEGMTPPSNEGMIPPTGEATSQSNVTNQGNEQITDATISESNTTTTEEAVSDSYKGMKATKNIIITGGDFKIDSADDALHCNENLSISGGTFAIKSGDDGIHSDLILDISGGNINIEKSYEGIESDVINISGGDITVVANDDGINVTSDVATTMQPGAMMQAADEATGTEETATTEETTKGESRILNISGGNVVVDAAGDGLDANGNIHMTGGKVIVNGPTNGANAGLDYDSKCEIDGGLLIVAGSSQMLQTVSSDSEQPTVTMVFSTGTQEVGTVVNIQDDTGKSIVSFAPTKAYQSIIVCSPDIEVGKTYTLSYGGKDTGIETNGLYENGVYEGGTSIGSFTVSDTITYLNETGVTISKQNGMMMEGHGGKRPNRTQDMKQQDAS